MLRSKLMSAATFAKSSDLAAWRALPAAGAKGKAALRRTCSREHL
ncbi:hypothetical protein RR11_2536 [Ruegeria sp. R11]|nr:hypothetical protein RR11_2536 [Ruegeria sp. R11]